MMLRKYRNALFEAIRAVNLDPRRFNPEEKVVSNHQSFVLRVDNSPLFFLIRETYEDDQRKFDYKFSNYTRSHPQPTFPESSYPPVWYDFDDILYAFKQWLETTARKYLNDRAEEEEDQLIPDLWSNLNSFSISADSSQALLNTPFSQEEQTRIAETLNELTEEVRKREILSEEQVQLLNERIGYLVESSQRLGRKDWLAAAAGALIGFTFQAGLTSEVAVQIIHLAGEGFQWITHTPMLLP